MGMGKKLGIGAAAFLALVAVTPMLFGSGTNMALACAGSTVDAEGVAEQSVAGFSGDQLVHASTIINTAATMGLSRQAQVVGVMTAIGESTLRNIDYGDEGQGITNPDGTPTCSLGLFQQQWCIGSTWGTKAQVMDPVHASTKFFERLVTVSGWEDMAPTIAANRVQGNADPNHYAKHVEQAETIVSAFEGETCSPGGAGGADGEWVRPVDAPVTSPYGPREIICNAAGCSTPFHYGLDFGAACGVPIRAVAGGTVTFTGGAGAFGNRVIVDHGDGIESVYGHVSGEYPARQGETVTAGDVVAVVGNTGVGTGCHLDLKIQVDGEHTDPQQFLRDRGVGL